MTDEQRDAMKAAIARLDDNMSDAIAKMITHFEASLARGASVTVLLPLVAKLNAALPQIVRAPVEKPSEQTKAIANTFRHAFK